MHRRLPCGKLSGLARFLQATHSLRPVTAPSTRSDRAGTLSGPVDSRRGGKGR